MDKDHWMTRESEIIPVVKMGDGHLINTIKFLRRRAAGSIEAEIAACGSVMSFIQGEYALMAVESDFNDLCSLTPDEYLERTIPCWELMLVEAGRRNLLWRTE